MADRKCSGYKVPNAGTAYVKAPNQTKTKPAGKVIKGKDLRSGK